MTIVLHTSLYSVAHMTTLANPHTSQALHRISKPPVPSTENVGSALQPMLRQRFEKTRGYAQREVKNSNTPRDQKTLGVKNHAPDMSSVAFRVSVAKQNWRTTMRTLDFYLLHFRPSSLPPGGVRGLKRSTHVRPGTVYALSVSRIGL